MRFSLICLCLYMCVGSTAQSKFQKAALESIPLFKEYLAIPNDANYPEDIDLNVDWTQSHLERRGFKTEIWTTPTRPILFGTYGTLQESLPTVLFYFHADGQSVDPQFWFQEDPYKAALKQEVEGEGWVDIDRSVLSQGYDPDLRIFARSSSDSKNNIIILMTAIDLLLQDELAVPYNLKVIIDFEEEKSSPSLAPMVEAHKDDLAADMLIIYDGPRHISGAPTVAFGARGIASLTLTTYGPIFPQHSGHYGNYAPNPALRMSRLLGSMKDDYGRVTIEGYYDDITIDQATAEILDAVPDDEPMINAKLGIAKSDSVANSYQRALQYPSLNIRGMSSGWVGAEARTIVPATATAEIDIRLVKESDPHRLISLINDHIVDQGYHIVDRKPTARERLQYDRICRLESKVSYEAFRTDFDGRVGRWITSAMASAFGHVPVRERTMGGSIPISPFVKILQAPAVVVPFANKDNNQHSPNENIRLGNYVDGVQAMYYILSTPVGD